jgi:Protein of unknown function (DUF3617)
MLNKKLIFLTIFVSLIWVAGASAEIKDGLWEITTKVQMKGVPAQMPATIVKQCVTKNNPVPQSTAKNYECKTKNHSVSGNIVTYTVECTGKNSTVLTIGETTYKGNTFDGTSTTTVKTKGQPDMQINNKISGKYIGPCAK